MTAFFGLSVILSEYRDEHRVEGAVGDFQPAETRYGDTPSDGGVTKA